MTSCVECVVALRALYSYRRPWHQSLCHRPNRKIIEAIPIAIYKGFVVFQKTKHTPKGTPIAIYEGFVVSKLTYINQKGNPAALCLCFLKTAPTNERNEHLLLKSKKVFVTSFPEACVKKG